jgi:hypothetical protein
VENSIRVRWNCQKKYSERNSFANTTNACFFSSNFPHKHYDSNSSLLVGFGWVWFRLGCWAWLVPQNLKSNNNFCSAKSQKILITTKPIIKLQKVWLLLVLSSKTCIYIIDSLKCTPTPKNWQFIFFSLSKVTEATKAVWKRVIRWIIFRSPKVNEMRRTADRRIFLVTKIIFSPIHPENQY